MFFGFRLPRCWLGAIMAALVAIIFAGCNDRDQSTNVQHDTTPRSASQPAAAPSDVAVTNPTVVQQQGSADLVPDQVNQEHFTPTSAQGEEAAPSMPAPPLTAIDREDGVASATEPETIHSGEPITEVKSSVTPLSDLLADVVIPPPWLAVVKTSYDTSQPWKEARLEIRRLLGVGKLETHREALKLTWTYLQDDNIGDGHEYPMYTFLGGDPLWSILAHEQFLAKPHENTPIHAHLTLASLYAQYGAFEKAKATLEVAMAHLPEPPWQQVRRADLAVALGDLYAAWDQPEVAKTYFQQAAELYPESNPPYGGHMLLRRAADAQAKLDRLTFRSLSSITLGDGEYHDTALGYAGDIDLTLVINGGRIADVRVRHEEKIDQHACVLVPQWIVEQQTLQVDGISGATVTRDAIVNGAYRCLKKAGLK